MFASVVLRCHWIRELCPSVTQTEQSTHTKSPLRQRQKTLPAYLNEWGVQVW